MKKKLFLAIVMTFVFTVALTFAVSAEETSVHNASTVDYNATVTLDDGTTVNLFDSNGDALIWYISGTDENGKNIYASITADDPQVKWMAQSWGEVTGVKIVLDDGTTISGNTFVVVNMMDDDVKSNTPIGDHTNYGKAITGFKQVFANKKNLEYCYLRLDTTGFFSKSFENDSKLKYVNLENLTKLTRIGDWGVFSNCTSLFKGEVLDLSKTALKSINGGGGYTFSKVPLAGIKLPSTLTTIDGYVFDKCTSLTTVCLGNKATSIGDTAFNGCTSLKTIYYVGTEDELGASPLNSLFTDATKISYTAYKALSDTDKANNTYVVYDYNKCEAYNKGVHTDITVINACVGVCGVCGEAVVKHAEDAETSVVIEYADYSEKGVKITSCNNDGCTYSVTENADALFTNKGFSSAENGDGNVVIGFVVNSTAISAYEKATGNALEYGVFAVLKDNVIDEDGNVIGCFDEKAKGVVKENMTSYSATVFELKITGFKTDANKAAEIAMGAYVIVTDKEENKVISYMQNEKPAENEKYTYTSYNDIYKSTQE